MLATGEENPVAKRENVLQKNISAPLIGIYGSELAERGERRRVAIFLTFFVVALFYLFCPGSLLCERVSALVPHGTSVFRGHRGFEGDRKPSAN